MLGFIQYSFKPMFSFYLTLVNLIVVTLLTMCFFSDSPIWFLVVISCYCSLLATLLLARWYSYSKYLYREAANTLRNMHRTWRE